MKSVLTIVAVLLIAILLLLIGVPCLFLWAMGPAVREEDRQLRRQVEEDRFTAAYWNEHDVSGLIEED